MKTKLSEMLHTNRALQFPLPEAKAKAKIQRIRPQVKPTINVGNSRGLPLDFSSRQNQIISKVQPTSQDQISRGFSLAFSLRDANPFAFPSGNARSEDVSESESIHGCFPFSTQNTGRISMWPGLVIGHQKILYFHTAILKVVDMAAIYAAFIHMRERETESARATQSRTDTHANTRTHERTYEILAGIVRLYVRKLDCTAWS